MTLPIEDNDLEPEPLKEVKKTMITGSLIIAILLALLFVIVLSDRTNESDRRGREAQTKVTARVEACHLYNEDQTLRRHFQIDNILTLARLQGLDVDTIQASAEFGIYVDFVNDSYPFRQCSPDCVNALYDPAIDDCPAASNENGDS